MKYIYFQFGNIFQNKAEILSFPDGDFEVVQNKRGINADFLLSDLDHHPLYKAHFENARFMKRCLVVEKASGERVGILIPTPRLGDKFMISLEDGKEYLINGWDRSLEITYKEENVGTIKLEHMVGAKYSLSLNDNLDLPSFFLFSLGAIILRDNLLL